MKSDLQLAAEAQRKGVWFTKDYVVQEEICNVWSVGQHGDRDAAMESAKDLMEDTLGLNDSQWHLLDHEDILMLDNFNLHAIESMLRKYNEPE